MLAAVPIKCANCGSNLEVTVEMTNFACGYCGASQIVERFGGTISLKLVSDAINRVQAGTDKTAAELALKRLSKELMEVEQAWTDTHSENSRKLDGNLKLFGGLWLGGIVICLLMSAPGGGAAVVAFLLGLGGTVGAIYLFLKQSAAIKAEFQITEQNLLKKGNDIERRIAQNKTLVD